MPKHDPTRKRAALLEQMAHLDSMERGTLSEEYRERPDGAGGTVRLGPYFKHQVWEAGANHSRRVPAEEVPELRQDLENHRRFAALVRSLGGGDRAGDARQMRARQGGGRARGQKKLQEQSAQESFRETEAFLQLA
jgi:hypothetical protein